MTLIFRQLMYKLPSKWPKIYRKMSTENKNFPVNKKQKNTLENADSEQNCSIQAKHRFSGFADQIIAFYRKCRLRSSQKVSLPTPFPTSQHIQLYNQLYEIKVPQCSQIFIWRECGHTCIREHVPDGQWSRKISLQRVQK